MIPLHMYFDAPEMFDAIIQGTAQHPTLPEGGDLSVITKHDGAISGRAIAMLTFTVQVEGVSMIAQAVTSIKLLKQMLRMIDAKYTDDGWPK